MSSKYFGAHKFTEFRTQIRYDDLSSMFISPFLIQTPLSFEAKVVQKTCTDLNHQILRRGATISVNNCMFSDALSL